MDIPIGESNKVSYTRALNMIAHEKKIKDEIEKRKKAGEKLAMEKDQVLKEHIVALKFELEQRRETIIEISTQLLKNKRK